DQRVVVAVAGAELEALGYETGGGEAALARRHVLGYAAQDAFLRAVNAFRLRIVQERGRELRHVLRRKLAGARG
ncbi:MAG: hypothetical protein ACRDNG_03315, partial [Gaiellaceae bacterium]